MNTDERETMLEQIRVRRGFIAPFHHMMMDLDPKIIEAYEGIAGLLLRQEGDNALDPKTQALVGVGIATAVGNDRKGIEQFTLRARKAGATDREIISAILMVALIGGMPLVEYAATVWQEMKQGKTSIDLGEA